MWERAGAGGGEGQQRKKKAMTNSSLLFGGPVAARVWRLQALRGSA